MSRQIQITNPETEWQITLDGLYIITGVNRQKIRSAVIGQNHMIIGTVMWYKDTKIGIKDNWKIYNDVI